MADVGDPHAAKMLRLSDSVLKGPGALDTTAREAAAQGVGIPEGLRAYLDKVAHHAYRIADEDVEQLRQAGYSEDQIFEATVSCAVGAGLRRLEAGLGAIEKPG